MLTFAIKKAYFAIPSKLKLTVTNFKTKVKHMYTIKLHDTYLQLWCSSQDNYISYSWTTDIKEATFCSSICELKTALLYLTITEDMHVLDVNIDTKIDIKQSSPIEAFNNVYDEVTCSNTWWDDRDSTVIQL